MIPRRTVPPAAALILSMVAAMGAELPARAQDAGVDADVCLEVAAGAMSDADWTSLTEGVHAAIASHPSLFPAPSLQQDGRRLDIWAAGAGQMPAAGRPCLEPGSEWSARFGRSFLEAGADRMLAEAPTTPGIDSAVRLEWHPQEGRLRTTLTFAGPLDIPNGTCWVDDRLAVDGSRGVAVAMAEQGRRTSPLAGWACDRFFEHLPDGGAGEQAVNLLPTTVEPAEGAALQLTAQEITLHDDAITIAGSIERAARDGEG